MRQPVAAACLRPTADRIRLPHASVMTHSKTIQSVFRGSALIDAVGAVWPHALAAAG